MNYKRVFHLICPQHNKQSEVMKILRLSLSLLISLFCIGDVAVRKFKLSAESSMTSSRNTYIEGIPPVSHSGMHACMHAVLN